MKSIIKIFSTICSFVILCVCLTGCGGQLKSEVKLNVKGNYVTSNLSEIGVFYAESSTDVDIAKNYKVTLDYSVGNTMLYKTNAVVNVNDSGNVVAFAKRIKNNVGESVQNIDYYYKDGAIFVHIENGKSDIEYKQENVLPESFLTDLNESINYLRLSNSFSEYSGVNTQIEKSLKDDWCKWKITRTLEEDQIVMEFYYIYDGDKLTGIKGTITQPYIANLPESLITKANSIGAEDKSITLNFAIQYDTSSIVYPKNIGNYSATIPENCDVKNVF